MESSANNLKWPAPPEYYKTGGPWEAPKIPAPEDRVWHTFSMPLEPPCKVNSASKSSSSSSSSTSSSTISHLNLRDVNLGHFNDIVLELRRKYAELVWALSRMDSSKEDGYDTVTKSIDEEFVKAQLIIEDYHPKLVLLETLEQLKEQTYRREQATKRLVATIGRARQDIVRDANRTLQKEE
tara:strand:+ start:31 stop:576 length:546 start_codon:yes stop_codon:yes gene_type:complete